MFESTLLTDLVVEVMDDRNVHGGRASLNPILANLVSVTWVNWVDLVAEVVNETHHGLETPSFGSQTLPDLTIILEWTE